MIERLDKEINKEVDDVEARIAQLDARQLAQNQQFQAQFQSAVQSLESKIDGVSPGLMGKIDAQTAKMDLQSVKTNAITDDLRGVDTTSLVRKGNIDAMLDRVERFVREGK
jgi:hypothetical protein